jgi:hypothetical protein
MAKGAVAVTSGLMVGLLVAFLAVGISGAGHGWNSAFISAFSVVGAPVSALAWVTRKKRAGVLAALAMLLAALCLDLVLWGQTMAEGTRYVRRVWESGPVWLLVWALLFASWQVLAASVIIGYLHPRSAA